MYVRLIDMMSLNHGLAVFANCVLARGQHVLEGVRAAAQLTHLRYESGTLTKYAKIVENYLTLAQGVFSVFLFALWFDLFGVSLSINCQMPLFVCFWCVCVCVCVCVCGVCVLLLRDGRCRTRNAR
jgi:hypothetical protein